MIIGRGLLANALSEIDNERYIFYVNGISNSVLSSIPRNNFEISEIEKLAKEYDDKVFIYFSTSQVNSKSNHHRAYVKHKICVEQLIINNFSKYLIIRTSNLVGNNPWNTHTLFNYLFNAININSKIEVDFDVIRNFLDVDHFSELIKYYLNNYEINKTIEIVNPISYSMGEVIAEFEKFYSKKFNLQKSNVKNDFALFELNPNLSLELMKIGGLSFDDHIQKLLRKYYSNIIH